MINKMGKIDWGKKMTHGRKRLKSKFKYSQNDINKVMFNLDALEVISDLVDLTPSGKSYVGKCPVCKLSKSPNHFRVTKKGKKCLYKCFVCGIGGSNGVSFVSRYFNTSFYRALEYCCHRYIKVDIITPILKDNARRNRVIIDDDLPF